MESKNIITSTNNIEGKVFVVRESGTYGGDDVTVPEDIHESRRFEVGSAEGTGLEECDSITLTSNCLERLCRCKGSRQGVKSKRRAKEANSVAGICVWSKEEDSCVKVSSNGAGRDPVGVRLSEAKAVTCVITFKSSIDDEVLSLVSSRESDG